MKMKFVIQHNLINPDQLAGIKEVLEKNILPYEFAGVIPFGHEIVTSEPLEGVDYIPYGSTLMTVLTREMGWVGNFFNPATFKYSVCAGNRDDMLNAYTILRVSDAITFMQNQEQDSLWFIRPDEDLKQFAGTVIAAADCAAWLQDAMLCESSGSYKLAADTFVVIAPPKKIQAEWRHFIIDGKVVSSAMYRRGGQLLKLREEDETVIAEAQTFADKWLPEKCCVMDLALVDDEVKVIEFNSINSSGFYNHNLEPIFTGLYKYCTEIQLGN